MAELVGQKLSNQKKYSTPLFGCVSRGFGPTLPEMRVSLDIDDTLVCVDCNMPVETGRLPAFLQRRLAEPLRRGTRSLVKELRRRGCSVWIYTSSEREPQYIRFWLWLHGIRVDGVVNGERHRHRMAGRKFARLPSKYPPAFGIDLHVDDSEGVRMEGDEHGFRVCVVRPDDEQWTDRVLEAVEELHSNATS